MALFSTVKTWCQCSNNNGQVFVQGYLIYEAPLLLPNHHSWLLCAKIFERQTSAHISKPRGTEKGQHATCFLHISPFKIK